MSTTHWPGGTALVLGTALLACTEREVQELPRPGYEDCKPLPKVDRNACSGVDRSLIPFVELFTWETTGNEQLDARLISGELDWSLTFGGRDPAVDLTTESIIAIWLGTQESTTWRAKIVRVVRGGEVVVYYGRQSRQLVGHSLTTPLSLAAVPREAIAGRRVRFEQIEQRLPVAEEPPMGPSVFWPHGKHACVAAELPTACEFIP